MTSFVNIPIIQTLLISLSSTIILTVLIRLVGRDGSGIYMSNASIGIVFAWICAFILGSPEFPPDLSSNAIVSAVICLLLIGTILDLLHYKIGKLNKLVEVGLFLTVGIILTVWMRGGVDLWLTASILAWAIIILGLQRVANNETFGPKGAIMVMALAALGVGSISQIGNILVDRDLSFALCAIFSGFFLCNLSNSKSFLGYNCLLAGGGSLYILTLRLTEQSISLIPTIIVLGFIFFTDKAIQYSKQKSALSYRIPSSLMFTVLALVPVVLACTVALITKKFVNG